MTATPALSAAAVAEFVTRGSNDFAALTVALALTTGIVAAVAGLRLGFLASFISELVLKGFIVVPESSRDQLAIGCPSKPR